MQHRYFELEHSDDCRTITGRALEYNRQADIAGIFMEEFRPNAFGDLTGADILMNLQHDRGRPLCRSQGGGLELQDSEHELRITATLPETQTGQDALTLIRNKVLRGLSIEFKPKEVDTSQVNGKRVRTITQAELFAVSVVDRPAFPTSVLDELRAKYCQTHKRMLLI